MKIGLIGAGGNVGSHLLKQLALSGHFVYTDLETLPSDLDFVLLPVRDSQIKEVASHPGLRGKCLVHTSGTVPIQVFESYTDHYGVLYFLQTFSKNKSLDFSKIHLCIEASDESTRQKLACLASDFSENVHFMNSGNRAQLHLAAVFACNFSNLMYRYAHEWMSMHGLDFSMLRPLVEETALKLRQTNPETAQTGPASRMDVQVLEKHLQMLRDEKPEWEDIYIKLSKDIMERVPESSTDEKR